MFILQSVGSTMAPGGRRLLITSPLVVGKGVPRRGDNAATQMLFPLGGPQQPGSAES